VGQRYDRQATYQVPPGSVHQRTALVIRANFDVREWYVWTIGCPKEVPDGFLGGVTGR